MAKALAEKAKRLAENPLKYVRQHAKQIQASNAVQAIRALFWGNRVGKTEWGGQETARVALGQHDRIPPGKIWVFCPSFDEQKYTTQEKLLRYIPASKILDRTWARKGIVKELKIDAGNGRESIIIFKSYEQGAEKVQGAGLTLIWFDEEPPYDIWEECFVRQEAGVDLHIILTMTPVKGLTWVYDEIYLNTGNPDLFVSEASWEDNPFLTEKQKAQMRRGLTAAALKVREAGKFVKKTGLVCSWFNRSTHLVDIQELPIGDTYFGIDFGFTNYCAGLWVRIDREFNFWIFDGFYRKGLTNPDIQKIIKSKEVGLGIVRRIGDSAQASDIKQLNDNQIKIQGVVKQPGTSKENWDEWRARLMEEQGRIQEATGKPKIFIAKSLVDIDQNENSRTYGQPINFFVKEAESLSWEEHKTSDGKENKSIWGKQPNHAIDAFSYIIATIHEPKKPIQPPTKQVSSVKPYYPSLGI